jgi:hypothetical protein
MLSLYQLEEQTSWKIWLSPASVVTEKRKINWGGHMARRRMIDPNFWQSEDVSKLTIRQRLLFIGIFSNADDEGKLRGNPAFVRSAVFPYEDFTLRDIEDDLNKVESIGSIHQYEVEGSKYIRLINWKKFQRVDKPQGSVIPDPVENDSKNDSENYSRLKERKGKEVKGEEKGKEDKIESATEPVPHSTYNDPIKDKLHDLITKCKLKSYNIIAADDIFFFIGKMDIEVIELAIKKAFEKHLNYAVNTLLDWMKEGKVKIEDHKPQAGDNDAKKSEGELRQGQATTDDKSVQAGRTGALPSKWANVVQMQSVSG